MPNLDFSEVQIAVLHIMMNKEETDYSTVDELSDYHYDNRRDNLCDLTIL